MKIKKIAVKKLFGIFDHEITINETTGITIVIGENGLGKTIILEMIKAFFNDEYHYFFKVDFMNISFEFTDGVCWVLNKINKENVIFLELEQINKNGKKYKPIQLLNSEIEEIHFFEDERNFLRKIGPDTWLDMRTGRNISRDQYFYLRRRIKRHQYMMKETQGNIDRRKWYDNRHKSINVSLIETQRLISLKVSDDHYHTKSVEKYSEELSQMIKSYLTKSTELSSNLDRTYPNRLIEKLKTFSEINLENLKDNLKKLEEKRKLLDKVGLIVLDQDFSDLDVEDTQDVVRNVLMLYTEDSFKKIKIFDEISEKISIFIRIINKRFKHKKLFIDKEKGFLFKSTIIQDGENRIIPVNRLSSGEQNELVLFYLLLFKTKKSSLILIDEPEVSLHISWQNCFIEDLKEIAKLNDLDVVIATHSPDIIGNNWELKVELKGLE